MNIIREVSKLCMFIVIWSFPLWLTRWSGNSGYLWFFILSIIVTVGVFSHYEELERINKDKDKEDETNE